jgi:phosphoglycolate phosphatase
MDIRVVVFDLDGTLFDTRADIVNAVNHGRAALGLPPLEFDRIVAMVGNGVEVLAERAFRDSTVTPEEAVTRMMSYYTPDTPETAQLYPGVKETLPTIGKTLTIVSNKPQQLVEALLEKNQIRQYFDYVAGGDTFDRLKPDPAAIGFFKQRYQIEDARQILVVGDHRPDVQMAQNAGVASVYCNYGFFGEDTAGADYAIDAFADLPALIRAIEDGTAVKAVRKPPEERAPYREREGRGRQREGRGHDRGRGRGEGGRREGRGDRGRREGRGESRDRRPDGRRPR